MKYRSGHVSSAKTSIITITILNSLIGVGIVTFYIGNLIQLTLDQLLQLYKFIGISSLVILPLSFVPTNMVFESMFRAGRSDRPEGEENDIWLSSYRMTLRFPLLSFFSCVGWWSLRRRELFVIALTPLT